MSLSGIADSTLCFHLTLTLAHFLWQGAAIAVLSAAASLCLRKASARSRHLIHVAALLLMTACLPVTFAVVSATVPASAFLPAVAEGTPGDKDPSGDDATIAETDVVPAAEVAELPASAIQPLVESGEPLAGPSERPVGAIEAPLAELAPISRADFRMMATASPISNDEATPWLTVSNRFNSTMRFFRLRRIFSNARLS